MKGRRKKVSSLERTREKLNQIAIDRIEFDTQVKHLEAEWLQAQENLCKLELSITCNDLTPLADLGVSRTPTAPGKSKSFSKKKSTKNLELLPGGGAVAAAREAQALQHMTIVESFIIPSGLLVSDWCFNGPLDSTPPGE
jgi:hypothetical protein